MTARPNPLHDATALLDEASRVLQYIKPRHTGYFVPSAESDDGALAVQVPVLDAGGELIDIVAYLPDMPSRWWLRTGLGQCLGEDAVERARCYATPVLTVGTPKEWTRERAYGNLDAVCLLNRARGRAVLAGIPIMERVARHAA